MYVVVSVAVAATGSILLIVSGNLIAVLHKQLLLQLFCGVVAGDGAIAWVGEDTQAMSKPLATRRPITSITTAQNLQMYCVS